MRRPITTNRRCGWAYTLIEVMVVVIILATAAAIVVPQAVDNRDIQCLSAARTLASDLEYAQNYAITLATPITVAFTPSASSYELTNASQAIIHPITRASSYTVSLPAQAGMSQVTLAAATFGGNAQVTFDETGAPDNSGSVTLQAGSHQYRIDVAAATGKVTVTGS